MKTEAEPRHAAVDSCIVVFQPDGACVDAAPGASILQVAREAGVALDSACGGQGTCGKCRVRVTLGRPAGAAASGLSQEEIEQGTVLACQATVAGDLVIEIPLESQRSELRILVDQPSLEPEPLRLTLPLAQRLRLDLAPPDQQTQASDSERLAAEACSQLPDDLPELAVDLAPLRELPLLARQQNWRLDGLVGDFDGRGVLFGLHPRGAGGGYGIAVDVGTTTEVIHLIDLEARGFVDACAALNEQVTYGADVISRIVYGEQHPDGLQQLRKAVLGTINGCIARGCERLGISSREIIAAACVGNTVMTQMLLGIEPGAIRREPYVPAVRSLPTLRAGEVGIDINPASPVYLAPCVSSYVGGDVVAGVLASGMAESPRLTLFIDMGTNGEMVVGSKEWLMCCSCSAGPAFEGAGLKHGMYATVGAMERFNYDPKTDRVEYLTIGEARPRGICGSGLVDSLAALLRAGVIDRAGRMNLGFSSRRVRIRDERPEFVLVWGEEVGREDDIALGEDDIQNLIRSKSAVYAGALTLLDSLGIGVSEIEQILVAGAFGNYLDAENAVTIGLLPDLPLDRIRFIGNAAVAGARLCLQGREARGQVEELASRMTNFELSLQPGYMERYVSGLFLPHTDLHLFPSVAEKLGLKA